MTYIARKKNEREKVMTSVNPLVKTLPEILNAYHVTYRGCEQCYG